MTHRTVQAYKAAFKFIHENLISLDGDGIIIDFESAMRTALLKTIPGIKVFGCWFHFCQCLRRKMASLPILFREYRSDAKVQEIFRQFQCLALLPPEMIEPIFLRLSRDALKTSENFAVFIDYFDKEWIKRVKPQHFSVFLRGTRTTSGAESFNCKVNKAFKTHANFFHFCECLQIEELSSTNHLENYTAGTKQKSHEKIFYKKRSKLIRKYSLMLKNGDIEPYLFLKTMANIKNKIVFRESEISVKAMEIILTNETELMEGSETQESFSCNEFDDNDVSFLGEEKEGEYEDEVDNECDITFVGENIDELNVSAVEERSTGT